MVLILRHRKSKNQRQQVDEVFKKKSRGSRHAWNKFFGKIKRRSSPVAFQRSLRDE